MYPNTEKRLFDAAAIFPDFKTHGDAKLEAMAIASLNFVEAMRDKREPYWLSFLGNSGTGKTFLSKMIFGYAKRIPSLEKHQSLIQPVQFQFWPKLLSQLRSGEYWRAVDLAECNFVVLDEVAVEHDPSGYAKDKLCEIMSSRCGKWTLITSNLTLEKIDALDHRLMSRIVRDGSVVLEVTAMDYALRGNE